METALSILPRFHSSHFVLLRGPVPVGHRGLISASGASTIPRVRSALAWRVLTSLMRQRSPFPIPESPSLALQAGESLTCQSEVDQARVSRSDPLAVIIPYSVQSHWLWRAL